MTFQSRFYRLKVHERVSKVISIILALENFGYFILKCKCVTQPVISVQCCFIMEDVLYPLFFSKPRIVYKLFTVTKVSIAHKIRE